MKNSCKHLYVALSVACLASLMQSSAVANQVDEDLVLGVESSQASGCPIALLPPPSSIPGARPFLVTDHTSVSLPDRYWIWCQPKTVGGYNSQFGLGLSPASNQPNVVTYSIPTPPSGQRWSEVRFTAVIVPEAQKSQCTSGSVTVGMRYAVGGVPNKEMILAPGAVVTNGTPLTVSAVLPEITPVPGKPTQLQIFVDSAGSAHCDASVIADPYWIPAALN